jgi:hypothetical protein
MNKQLTKDGQNIIRKALVKKISSGNLEMKKLINHYTIDENSNEIIWGEPIKRPYTEKLEKSIKALKSRIEVCQLSLNIVEFQGHGWISFWRDEHIKHAQELLENKLLLLKEEPENKGLLIEIENIQYKIKSLIKAKKCTRKDCYQRGYIGLNIKTAEYSFCQCTLNTIQFYNLS